MGASWTNCLLVTGTINAPPNSGVLVNGAIAQPTSAEISMRTMCRWCSAQIR